MPALIMFFKTVYQFWLWTQSMKPSNASETVSSNTAEVAEPVSATDVPAPLNSSRGDSSMSSFGKFVLGAAVGGVVGGVIGLLLAPRPGHETRQMLADEMNRRVDDTKTAIKDGVDHSVNVAKERVNDAKERVNDTVDTVRNRAQELSDKAKQLGEEFEETGRRTLSAIGQSKPATKES